MDERASTTDARIVGQGTTVDVQILTEPTGALVIQVIGELDLSTIDPFRAAIAPVVDGNPERLVFDFEGLHFMDSSAIAVLVQLSTHVCPVEVRNPTRTVRKLIEITGLADLLNIDRTDLLDIDS
jgi:stage II sporulation protein AA (anti-sigma F factor antagonist)